MTLSLSLRHRVPRLFLWLGILILAYAGSVTAYSEAYQRYQAAKFAMNVAMPRLEGSPDLHEGDIVGRLEVPRIGLSVIVLQGTEESTLVLGAGHVPGTPLPAAGGNVVIAAHRDTFFRKLNVIAQGDRIRLVMKTRTYEYVVSSTQVVDPDVTGVMESGNEQELTLITCYPFYFIGSAPKRFIVRANAGMNTSVQ